MSYDGFHYILENSISLSFASKLDLAASFLSFSKHASVQVDQLLFRPVIK